MEQSTSGISKFLGYFITLVIGLSIGFFIGKKSYPGTTTAPAADTTKVAYTNIDTNSHHLSDSLAHVLIAAYEEENTTAANPLKTNKGELLRGFFIDRKPIEHILKNQTLDGISIYFAKDSAAHATKKPDRMYTLIYIGGKYNKSYKAGGTEPKMLNVEAAGDTDTYDFVKPCPNSCGDLQSLTRTAAKKTTPVKK